MVTRDHLKILYLSRFSKPLSDRPIYQAIQKRRVRRILELGIGLGLRAVRMIQVAGAFCQVERVCYTGVDRFEARTAEDGPGLPLKSAHRLLTATDAQVRLIPGDPLEALSRAANTLEGTDLVVISAPQATDSLRSAWFYFPRMLRDGSLVMIEETEPSTGQLVFRPIWPAELADLAAATSVRRAA